MNNINDEEELIQFDGDYYQLLNVEKSADSEEITAAYRRFSKIYHPDKHGSDPVRNKWAEQVFTKLKEAYDVLSDPHRRAIYDTLGKRGLEVEGWEVICSRSPNEIREEYERLKKEREERRLQQSTNPRVVITVSVDATDLFNQYYDEGDDTLFPSVEISGMAVQQSIDVPASTRDTVSVSSQISTQNGIGSGSINLCNRHIMSEKGWMDVELGLGSNPTLGFKVFRTLSRILYLSGGTVLQFSSKGINLNFVTTLAAQLDNHSVGYLSFRQSSQGTSITSTFVHDSEKHHASLTLQLGMPHSLIGLGYVRKLQPIGLKLKMSSKFGTFGVVAEYGAEKKVSQHTSVSASIAVGIPTGVTLKLKWIRATHTIVVPVHLCEEVMPAPVFYGTIAPILTWLCVKKLILDPIEAEKKKKELEKCLQENMERIREMRKSAMATIDLMRETYSRIRLTESRKSGLVIIKAVYGKLPEGAKEHAIPDDIPSEPADIPSTPEDTPYGLTDTIDVTIPLQCLVNDSRLVLTNGSKVNLAGFYDPCIGEEKHLTIRYSIRNRFSNVTIADNESVKLPKPRSLTRDSLRS